MRKYNLCNNALGWLCFIIAAITYMLTLEPTASFWDCPEFIAQGTKLEVGHPPGNPIFMLAARFFVNFSFGDMSKAALMVNAMSGLLSAATIMLLFWTITHLVKRLIVKDDATDVSVARMIVIFGSGLCGALMYAWSDTFWFSAVEGEVYAFSSFCTALVFWLILKWENRADQPNSDRYLILIAYIIGVSIAVHLLNLLCIPAICLVIYYRKFKNTSALGSLITLGISAIIVALILYGLVPGFIEVSQYFELFFVNRLHLSYNIGVLVYALLFVVVSVWCIFSLYQQKSALKIKLLFMGTILLSGIPFIGNSLLIPIVIMTGLALWLFLAKKISVRILTIITLSVTVIFVGYSSYALLLIRSHANPPMNQNAPDNVFSLGSYLNREQYGETPLFYGPTFTSERMREIENSGDYPYVTKGTKTTYSKVVKTNPDQPDQYVGKEKPTGVKMTPQMLFPRMHSQNEDHIQGYMDWAGITDLGDLTTVDAPYIVDQSGNVVQSAEFHRPTFSQNLAYFFNYQLGHMYWRYFMWNFAGRQNDIAGNGEPNRGNWISGIPAIDNARLGDQSLLPEEYGTGNKGHNVFFMLPLLMGLLGLCWQAFWSKRGIEQFWVVFFFFFMTGIAIVLYLNQPPMQPRERDYAFAGSFYAFAIWVGMGVSAIWALGKLLFSKFIKATNEAGGEKQSAICAAVAAVIGILVPIQVVSQTWDDHDRSGRYTTRDYGMNYLAGLDENAIIFTNGDNDTFPLWYAQEVEGFRTDVRVINLMYLTTDWYANQMRVATDGAPAVKTMAEPIDYAGDRLSAAQLMPSGYEADTTMNVFTALDYFYHRSENDFGSPLFRYPKMYIPANVDAAVKANVISERERSKASDQIFVDLANDPDNKTGYVTLSQALSLDMLATSAKNGWERPVYFAMTVPDLYYLSLSPYMRNTGITYQVTPIRSNRNTSVSTDKMYENVTEKFRWGGLDQPGATDKLYLDETVRRMVATHRTALLGLVNSLLEEGVLAKYDFGEGYAEIDTVFAADRFAKAENILKLMEEKLPEALVPYSIQMGQQVADAYFDLASETGNDAYHAKAMDILRKEIDRYAPYLPYFNDLNRRAANTGGVNALYIADRYIPNYLLQLLQDYADEGGDLQQLQKEMFDKGINLNDIQNYHISTN